MVIADSTTTSAAVSRGVGTPSSSESALALASAWERIGAATVDAFSVAGPLVILAIAPLRRQWLLALHTDSSPDHWVWIVAMVVTGLVVFLLYQTLMNSLFGASIGKMVFGIRVIDVWTRKNLTLGVSLLRASIWVAETLPLGLPFFAVFYNPKRRPLHDRIADSVVVSGSRRGAGEPSLVEASFGQSVLAMAWAIVAVALSFTLHSTYRELHDPDLAALAAEEHETLCRSVSQGLREWQDRDKSTQDRLDIAMAMYLAGSIGEECLDLEAQFAFKHFGPTPIAYLAKSFVEAQNDELSNSYLDEVCRVDHKSLPCRVSELLQMWSRDEKREFQEGLEAIANVDSIYVRVWAIRHMISHDLFVPAEKYLAGLQPFASMKGFLGMARVRASWGRRDEDVARLLARTLYENLEPDDRLELAAWMCLAELNRSCDDVDAADCRQMSKELGDSSGELEDRRPVFATVRRQDCRNEPVARDLRERVRSAPLRKILDAYEAKRAGRWAHARQELRGMVDDSANSAEMRSFALGLWLDWDRGPDLRDIAERWQNLESSLAWHEAGTKLLHRLSEARAWSQVVAIGDRLEGYRDLKEPTRAIVLGARQKSPTDLRSPASVKGRGKSR